MLPPSRNWGALPSLSDRALKGIINQAQYALKGIMDSVKAMKRPILWVYTGFLLANLPIIVLLDIYLYENQSSAGIIKRALIKAADPYMWLQAFLAKCAETIEKLE